MPSKQNKNIDDKEVPKTKTFIKDIIIVLAIVAAIGIALYAVSGTWPALVAVESGSMEPNIPTYSLVFVSQEDRYGGWMTQAEALETGAEPKFNGYGDVIVYKPNGISGVTPIIHRATGYVTEEQALALGFEGEAAHAGYLTKGDNNDGTDQMGYLGAYGRLQPVKPEWIIGKAVFSIPFIGWIPLNMWICAIIIIALIIAIELIIRKRGSK